MLRGYKQELSIGSPDLSNRSRFVQWLCRGHPHSTQITIRSFVFASLWMGSRHLPSRHASRANDSQPRLRKLRGLNSQVHICFLSEQEVTNLQLVVAIKLRQAVAGSFIYLALLDDNRIFLRASLSPSAQIRLA